MTMASIKPHRRQALWGFAIVHRVSGLLLGLFLPVHFCVLALSLNGAESLDAFLSWTASPVVKAAETVLVFLLAVHFLGGLRILALEMLPWRDGQKALAAYAAGVSVLVACLFLLNAG